MKKSFSLTGLLLSTFSLALIFNLTACNNNSKTTTNSLTTPTTPSVPTTSTTPEPTVPATSTTPSTPATTSLTGTVAVGVAFVGDVEVVNADGDKTSTTIAGDGSYSVSIANGAPYMLRAVAADGTELYSFSENGGTANITELSNLALYLATSGNSLNTLFADWVNSQITSTIVDEAAETVRKNLQQQFTANNLSPTYNFLTEPFTVGSAGIDRLMDGITVVIDFNQAFANSVQILEVASGNSLFANGFTFDFNDINSGNTVNSGNAGSGSTDSFTNSTLTITGKYLLNGIGITIPAIVINNIPAPGLDDFNSLEQSVAEQYGGVGTVNVTVINNTATQRTFRLQFSGAVSGFNVNYDLNYDYVIK